MISFFKKISTVVLEGTKTETRRDWGGNSHFEGQKRALDEHLFVRVWCGVKGNLIGYIQYLSFTRQRLGDMTQDDVVREGGGAMTVDDFRKANFPGVSDEKILLVVRFIFFPLHQQEVGA